MHLIDGQYWSQSFSSLLLAVASLAVLVTLGFALILARHHSLAAQRARIAMEKKVGLFVGDALVTGVVETDDKAPAIRVEIQQQGKERRTKRGYSHTWTEYERTQTTRPFRLRIPGGTVVHVEPGKEVFLVDDLTLFKHPHHGLRVLHAELTHGESVSIEGRLKRTLRPAGNGEGDYRGQQQAWTLRPPSTGPMLLSTEPLPQRHEERASFWLRAAGVLTLFFVVGHGYLTLTGFWPLMLRHECCDVQVESQRNWVTQGSRHRTRHHSAITGTVQGQCGGGPSSTPVGTVLVAAVTRPYAVGEVVPFQVQRGNAAVFRMGTGVGLTLSESMLLAIFTFALFGIGYSRFRASLPWYETKLKQTYPGRLE